MPFTGNYCRNKDRNRKKRRFRAGVLLLLLLLFGDNRVYAQEAAVVFGEEEYLVGEGAFVIDVLLRAEGNIGAYQVSLRYDTDRMEYVSGAEEASEGVITLEGTGFGSEVSYTLEFRTSVPEGRGSQWKRHWSIRQKAGKKPMPSALLSEQQ